MAEGYQQYTHCQYSHTDEEHCATRNDISEIIKLVRPEHDEKPFNRVAAASRTNDVASSATAGISSAHNDDPVITPGVHPCVPNNHTALSNDRCPKGHKMDLRKKFPKTLMKNGVVCNKCGAAVRKLKKNEYFHRCERCDYDVCTKCATNRVEVENVGKTVPTIKAQESNKCPECRRSKLTKDGTCPDAQCNFSKEHEKKRVTKAPRESRKQRVANTFFF